MKKILFVWMLLGCWIVSAQDLRRIFRTLEKEELSKVFELLDADISKYPNNPGSRWMYARLLSCDTIPQFYYLNKARIYAEQAVLDFNTAEEKILNEFLAADFTLQDLETTLLDIEHQTKVAPSGSYNMSDLYSFLSSYPQSSQKASLLYIIDSLAFDSVAHLNDWNAYWGYTQSFPYSRFSEKANNLYEKLLYEEKTAGGLLSDYQRFTVAYPQSAFRQNAIETIFQKTLNQNDYNAYLNHISSYPNSQRAQEIISILYHLDKTTFFECFTSGEYPTLIDSLHQIALLDQKSLLTILVDQKFGMIDLNGHMILEAKYNSFLGKNVLCELFETDILGVTIPSEATQLINRAGIVVYSGVITNYQDIGLGFLKIETPNGLKIIHKSGKIIFDSLQDAAIVGGKWLKIKNAGKWALATFTGKILTPFSYDDIQTAGAFWIFKLGNHIALHNIAFVSQGIEKENLVLSLDFDDFELLNDSLAIVYNQNNEALLSIAGDFLIPWESARKIVTTKNYRYSRSTNDYKIYDEQYIDHFGTDTFSELIANDHWFAFKNNKWNLVIEEGGLLLSQIDSLFLVNGMSLAILDTDSSYVLFPNGTHLTLDKKENLRSLSYRDERGKIVAEYLQKEFETVKEVYNSEGVLMFKGAFEDIYCLTDSLFKVTKDKKQGLLDKDGEIIILPLYDFIEQKENIAQLLRNGKIEGFDLVHKKIIVNPADGSLERFGSYYLTQKNTSSGVIDENGETIIDFKYDEIIALNDSLSCVKKNDTWDLIAINDQNVILTGVRKFQLLSKKGEVYRYFNGEKYGLFYGDQSQHYAPEYTDIRAIFNDDITIFLLEIYIPSAPFHILIAKNFNGEQLYSRAYRPDDYERIMCEF